ncbi:MAG: formate--tetrahydrofolate ligase [Clostridia bacterium]|nr:formate--tetrahydrofolate ligase [Clostridia bacterium]
MKDIEIARSIVPKKINEVTTRLGIPDEYIEQYGKYKAKISNKYMNELNHKEYGKLILVTAINPTPLGEGKTTVSIGLADALNKLDKKAVLALREPSLGPVFGIKGGATGGGYAQIIPMEDINLHFTGDIHAITSANNLLAAMIDNHLYFGNKLKIKKVIWKRCVDLNDRALRKIQIGLSGEKRQVPREDGFDITVASEVMAIFCLAKDLEDLRRRLGNIIIGYNEEDMPVFAKDLKAEGAMTVLLKDAFNPNIVQTLEGNPAIVHGGPFANIAHGCNSVVATKMALKLREYTVTEAGFGADLGAEKFLDIKCRNAGIKPNAVVCVATIKALKYHGGLSLDQIKNEHFESLRAGTNNLLKHVDNIKNKFKVPVVVAINRYEQDTEAEIELLGNILKENDIEMSLTEVWAKGSEGAIDLANKVIAATEIKNDFTYMYELNRPIVEKIKNIAKKVYGAEDVEFSEEAQEEIKRIEKLGYGNYPVCIAKTQYSFSDNAKNLECKEPFKIHVREIILKNGAEFIVAITGNIFTMPGLPEVPSAEKIDLDDFENIEGIF